jgi:hypothetical protein
VEKVVEKKKARDGKSENRLEKYDNQADNNYMYIKGNGISLDY